MNKAIYNAMRRPYGAHPHYLSAREQQVENHAQNHAVAAIVNNFKRALIPLVVAVQQLRDEDRFEAEINTMLSRALADRLLPKCITGVAS